MADLIAEGTDSQHRWRRLLPEGQWLLLGRSAGIWSVPWDERVSRRHAEIRWNGTRLEVSRLATARNPIFSRGTEANRFEIRPGEHFVIGNTKFTVAEDQAQVSLDAPQPVREQAFSSQYLQHVQFRNADQRIEVLSRLPDVISGATDDNELFMRLVNLLLTGLPRASAVALVDVGGIDAGSATPRILHWDRRYTSGGRFQPSQRLILKAVRRGQSVLHVWGTGGAEASVSATMSENLDWAFCVPVRDAIGQGTAIYVTGAFSGGQLTSTPSEATDLRDDLKFTELAAAILSSLRQAQRIQRWHATLSQFFAPAVLEVLAAGDPDVTLRPRETEVTVLFCDLRGFSLQAEESAGDLIGLLNRVSAALGVMTRQILDRGGVVGDYQGDAAMGFWGWPLPQEDAGLRACQAALSIRRHFEQASQEPDNPLAGFQAGIGIARGRAVAGKIGTLEQVKVTVFGPVVNLASRLEGMTKMVQCPILIDEATAASVRDQMPAEVGRLRRVATVRPYGLEQPVTVSELLPPASEYPQLTDQHIADYEAALAALADGDWMRAYSLLHRIPPDDRVKDFLTVYIARHNRVPPADWAGFIPMTSK